MLVGGPDPLLVVRPEVCLLVGRDRLLVVRLAGPVLVLVLFRRLLRLVGQVGRRGRQRRQVLIPVGVVVLKASAGGATTRWRWLAGVSESR